MRINIFAEIISELPLIIILLSYPQDKNLIIGMLLSIFLSERLKKINYPENIRYRPKGNYRCDYINNNNLDHTPALPSSHMTAITFYVIYQYMRGGNKSYFLLILLMGWARYIKNCHNLIQISAGTIFGSIFALLYI
jgi:membrane-associated phospholipid phosphatase